MSETTESAALSPRAFSYRSFQLFWAASALTSFAAQIMSVSVGLQIYRLTHNPALLGLVGLAQFLPALTLVLVTGLASDKFNRRLIMAGCLTIELLCAIALFLLSGSVAHEVWPIYVVLVALGVGRAFMGPASSSLAPNIVPPQALASAISLNASSWQLANILGPVIGGILADISLQLAFGTAGGFLMMAAACVLFIAAPAQRISSQATDVNTLLAGFRYIWKEQVVLGAISLDLFAVLLGGAVALMPVFALDILHVGGAGLGLLRAAPGVGAIITALILMVFPIKDRSGWILFSFVALFGFFTMMFGISQSIWLSVPLLMLMGACDMVSVSIRETLMQLWTPDEVRGRVSAVNSVFIGASNELGEFRAGMMAAFIGAQAAVTIGGVATMGVAAIWSRAFPGLRTARGLDKKMA